MPGTRYYYADDNSQPVGPLSLDEIRKFADAGVVRPDVMVCKEDGSVWWTYPRDPRQLRTQEPILAALDQFLQD